MKKLMLLGCLLLPSFSFAQTISGVINSYFRVTSVDVGNRQFVVDNLYGNINDFQAGSSVLVYQAKGAAIETANTSDYGTITAYNNAGNYEFTTIESISGSGPYTITVVMLENAYTASGSVQLVSIPQYENVEVTGTVTAEPWDAASGRGGILVFEVADELTLGADIDVSGQGFAGGIVSTSNGDCPDGSTYTTTNTGYAGKGEGISTEGNAYARGARANGGGGGNPHNAGGGGGSNYTYGGNGGEGYQSGCGYQNAGGITGKSIDYTSLSGKIFFGGGGGAGQQNNGLASAGANGGGIVIIRAETVTSGCASTYGIYADGNAANNSGGNDGAGGGGAGGSIVLDVINFTNTCDVLINAHGGNGGSVNTSSSHGGGGGGGIGIVMEVHPTDNAYVDMQSEPGTNGADCNSGCDTPTGTEAETPSSYKESITEVPGIVMVLPIELVAFTGKMTDNAVQLAWVTASEVNNDYFTLEKSTNGKDFVPFKTIEGAGNSTNTLHYVEEDNGFYEGTTYYRLKQTDYDGQFSYSDIIRVETGIQRENTLLCYPNPAAHQLQVVNVLKGTTHIYIKNSVGHVLIHQIVEQTDTLDVSGLKAGVYFLETVNGVTKNVQKIIIKR